jgi:hypothetical protein
MGCEIRRCRLDDRDHVMRKEATSTLPTVEKNVCELFHVWAVSVEYLREASREEQCTTCH